MFSKPISLISFIAIILCSFFVVNTYAQTVWTRYEHNPILIPGETGAWDENFAVATTVLYHDNIYKMWYEGDEGFGYATSLDGLIWTKDTIHNPVLQPGPSFWDALEIANASVLFVDNTYRMWYSGVDLLDENQIGHAVSPDGINWTKDPLSPVLQFGPQGSWDENELIHPFVIYEDSIYKMWYNGHDGNTQRILYATSSDGIDWSRFVDHPALEPGQSGLWDDHELGPLCVLHNQDGYHMWYTGFNQSGLIQIGYATSADGITWTKDVVNNPVLIPDSSGFWDDSGVAFPFVLQEENILKMWYGGTDGAFFQSGYATSEIATSINGNQTSLDDFKYSLEQNYPNPFNSKTTINYQLEFNYFVELTVYNALGKKVASLVNQKQQAGQYNVSFHGCGLASGIYYYKLSAGSIHQVRKMILLR